MMQRRLGRTGIDVSVVGLGCSRLGSVLGADADAGAVLIHAALDRGITFFDTSDLYGQGDSERLLGRILAGRDNVTICTKVGKRHSLTKRLLIPLKGPLGALTTSAVAAARGKPVPVCFEPGYLDRALHASLRRLNTERLDGVMLHSPNADVLRRGDAVGALARMKDAGKIGFIGVSVDDLEAGDAAVADGRVEAIQAPLRPGEPEWVQFSERAGARTCIVAREVLGGHGRRIDGGAVAARLNTTIATPGVTTVLIGTTSADHLAEATNAISSLP